MNDLLCLRCGYTRREHSYNGACYGLCGEFVTVGVREGNSKMIELSKMDLAIIRCALQTELSVSINRLDDELIRDLYNRIMAECAKREALEQADAAA